MREATKKVVLLFGPTASGKTRLLFRLADLGLPIALINADSVQVYQGLDIGSAKPDLEERKRFPHYLIDILPPDGSFSVARFIKLADEAVDDCISKGIIPIVSGGTAFYFKHFIYGLSEAPESIRSVREKWENYLRESGPEKLREELERVDPRAASRIDKSDTKRTIRALEVFEIAGRPMSSFSVPTAVRKGYEFLVLRLQPPRERLKEQIFDRTKQMFDRGLRTEVEGLRCSGACIKGKNGEPGWQSMGAIGYSEFFRPELEGASDAEMIEAIARDTFHYAKRQETFFKTFKGAQIVSPEEAEEVGRLVRTFVERVC